MVKLTLPISILVRQKLKRFAILIYLSFVMLLYTCTDDEPQHRYIYTDQEVKAFIDRFEALASGIDGVQAPENILKLLDIDTTALNEVDLYLGGCINAVVYDFSPSYELVVDDNDCFGFDAFFRKK